MTSKTSIQTKEHIFTISELNRVVHGLLETHFPTIWIEGEISNFICPKSGHWYFSLKDQNAQIRCALFRGFQRQISCQPKDGMQVLIRAKVSLYEGRGDFQLIVDYLEEAGIGALQRQFEQLKKKLDKEGLFDQKYKKPIPTFPNCLGVITSPTGAAIRDILNVLNRRFPALSVIIYPTLVQGEEAATQIVTMIETANQRKECDVLLLSRGGGSLEYLWSFNEETVAREIFKSKIPIVTGVGHEIDFTIADFVADVRAPTPSAAAELISPNQSDLLQLFKKYKQQLLRNLKLNFENKKTQLNFLQKHLIQQHPKTKIQQVAQCCDHLEQLLINSQKQLLKNYKQHWQQLKRALTAMSPLNTLNRGYAIVTNQNGQIISNSKQTKKGEKINTKLKFGQIKSIVE